MPHRKFNRLPKPLEFIAKTTDVLVGNLADTLKPADRTVGYDYLGPLADDDRIRGIQLDDLVCHHLRLDKWHSYLDRYRVAHCDRIIDEVMMNG